MRASRMLTALGSVSLAAGMLLALAPAPASEAIAQAEACPAPPAAMTFAEPTYVDMTRAGGEPMIQTHPDGTLLYGSHAGTTHFYGPAAPDPATAAFIENYEGQTYQYWSDDNGATWNFVERLPNQDDQLTGLPNSGFSDPDFAIDAAGNVFISEINLANVAVSKSSDVGRSYHLQNFFGQTITDRQWKEADEEDVVYIVGNAFAGGTFPTDPVGHVGHTIYKSTDGGVTFSTGVADGDGLGDLRLDKSDGTLYEAYLDSQGVMSLAAFRNARNEDVEVALTPELHTIAEGVNMLSHWPALDVDPSGNLYITWDESGAGDRAAGVWYSYSLDRGRNWAAPVRVDPDDRTDIWPWLAVGDDGRVAVAWFGNDSQLEDHNAELAGAGDPWHVYFAQTLNGLGCEGSATPGFEIAKATTEPFHTGTVCQGGTVCQARLVDRRLGDYFSIEIDGTGAAVGAWSDTREGGSVALPAFVRQSGGPSFFGQQPTEEPTEPTESPTSTPTTTPTTTPTATPTPTSSVAPTATATTPPGGALPTTGGAAIATVAGLVLLAAALGLRGRGASA